MTHNNLISFSMRLYFYLRLVFDSLLLSLRKLEVLPLLMDEALEVGMSKLSSKHVTFAALCLSGFGNCFLTRTVLCV